MSASDDYATAQQSEYGKWKAKVAIFIDGVRAFNPGHPVPTSHVEERGYDKDGLVELQDGSDHVEEITSTPPLPQGDPIMLNPSV